MPRHTIPDPETILGVHRHRIDSWVFLVERAANSGLDARAAEVLDKFTALLFDGSALTVLLRVLPVVERPGDWSDAR